MHNKINVFMTKKIRKLEYTVPGLLQEPAVAYQRIKISQNPCCFTDKEKINRIEQSVKDAEAGLGVTEEIMFNRHPEWL